MQLANGRRPSGSDGFALVITMLILTALTLPAVGLLAASHRDMASTSSEISRRMATRHADSAAVEGGTWLASQNALGPPERVNLLGISDPSDPHYWTIRNYGGIGDSDGDVASNFGAIAPDTTWGDDTPNEATSWYRVASVPDSSRHVNRVAGEEAGTGVQERFVVDGVAQHGRSAVRLRIDYDQVYGTGGYE